MATDATFPLASLKPNDRNPRYITEPDFELLIDSLLGFPEMLDVRGIVYSREAGKKAFTTILFPNNVPEIHAGFACDLKTGT